MLEAIGIEEINLCGLDRIPFLNGLCGPQGLLPTSKSNKSKLDFCPRSYISFVYSVQIEFFCIKYIFHFYMLSVSTLLS